MHDLYIIESPFQLLCATEANLQLGGKRGVLIVYCDRRRTRNEAQIQAVLSLDLAKWEKVVFVRYKSPWSLYFKLSFLKNIELRKFDLDKVFVGNFLAGTLVSFGASFKAREFFFLDDGAASLAQHAFPPRKLGVKTLLRKIFLTFLGLNASVSIWDKSIFTIFGDSIHKFSDIRRHSFQTIAKKLKDDAKCEIEKGKVMLIGQCMVERGVMEKENYFHLIRNVLKSLPSNCYVEYISHRDEDPSNVAEITREFAIHSRTLGVPIEIFMMISRYLPEKCLAFYSTALFTVPLFFPDVEYLYVKIPSGMLKTRRDSISEIYNQFSNVKYLNEFKI
ncbi:MAG: polysialyltransferase family glycosyltransferase [Oligoflexales bacterium]